MREIRKDEAYEEDLDEAYAEHEGEPSEEEAHKEEEDEKKSRGRYVEVGRFSSDSKVPEAYRGATVVALIPSGFSYQLTFVLLDGNGRIISDGDGDLVRFREDEFETLRSQGRIEADGVDLHELDMRMRELRWLPLVPDKQDMTYLADLDMHRGIWAEKFHPSYVWAEREDGTFEETSLRFLAQARKSGALSFASDEAREQLMGQVREMRQREDKQEEKRYKEEHEHENERETKELRAERQAKKNARRRILVTFAIGTLVGYLLSVFLSR